MTDIPQANPPNGLGGMYNLRRLGDYAVAGGGTLAGHLLWRSADLHVLDDAGRQFLRDLQVRTIIDLRDEAERVLRPNALGGIDARIVALPLSEESWAEWAASASEDSWAEWAASKDPGADPAHDPAAHDDRMVWTYERKVHELGRGISAVVTSLVQPDALPALIHCTAGKDRTGVVFAVLLSALGVRDEDIVADYARSADLAQSDWFAQFMDFDLYEVSPEGIRAEPAWIQSVLTTLCDTYGGADTYLLQHGLDDRDLERLRALLVVDDAEAR